MTPLTDSSPPFYTLFSSRDNFKADFILQAYLSDEKTLEHYKSNPKDRKARQKSFPQPPTLTNDPLPGPSSSQATASRDYDLETSQVIDLFPHLGDGFIRKLLSRYENSEQAISAIIESNLPPDMVELDQTEPYIPEDPRDAAYKETGIHRPNVFAGDALDVMTNDALNCTVKYKGITVGGPNAQQVLDDKSHLKETRQRYEEYGMVAEGGADEYDDEYDDTYEAMAESESKARRSKGAKVVYDESSSEEEEEEDGAEASSRPKDAFCENPEVIRARREQAWQAKCRRGGGGGGGGGWSSGPKRDVVGTGVKGQGQADSVLLNRQKKDQNKSSRANHNRRQGANFKRSRGMIPS